MTPKELLSRLSKRAGRWHDELDTYAAELVRHLLDDAGTRGEGVVQAAIDTVREKK